MSSTRHYVEMVARAVFGALPRPSADEQALPHTAPIPFENQQLDSPCPDPGSRESTGTKPETPVQNAEHTGKNGALDQRRVIGIAQENYTKMYERGDLRAADGVAGQMSTTQLARYEKARKALAEAHSVDEVKEIHDKAAAASERRQKAPA